MFTGRLRGIMEDLVTFTPDFIRQHFEAVRALYAAPTIDTTTFGPSLLEQGLAFHELSWDQLRAALVGLTRVGLVDKRVQVVLSEHAFLWAWIGQVLLTTYPPTFLARAGEEELGHALDLALRAVLSTGPPDDLDRNSAALLRNRHELAAYIAFPVLESTMRRANADVVNRDGVVIRGPEPNWDFRPGGRCNSIAKLLVRYTGLPSVTSELKDDIANILSDLGPEPYQTIQGWRNPMLHGEYATAVVGGTVLALATRVLLEEIRADYEELAERQRSSVTFWAPHGGQQSHFYPPG